MCSCFTHLGNGLVSSKAATVFEKWSAFNCCGKTAILPVHVSSRDGSCFEWDLNQLTSDLQSWLRAQETESVKSLDFCVDYQFNRQTMNVFLRTEVRNSASFHPVATAQKITDGHTFSQHSCCRTLAGESGSTISYPLSFLLAPRASQGSSWNTTYIHILPLAINRIVNYLRTTCRHHDQSLILVDAPGDHGLYSKLTWQTTAHSANKVW